MLMLTKKKEGENSGKREGEEGEQKNKQQFYVMKRYKKKSERDLSLSLNIVPHPFLVPLRYFAQTETKCFLFMDYVEGGEFFRRLRQNDNNNNNNNNNNNDNNNIVMNYNPQNEILACFYGAEICCALEYLHKNDIFGVLNPRHILLNQEVRFHFSMYCHMIFNIIVI